MLRKFTLSLLLTITTAISAEVTKERVLCFGDSITQGTYIEGKYVKNKSWVDTLQRNSGDTLICINEGRSGRKTSNKHELLKAIKRNPEVDHVIFYLGVNDLHESTEEANKQNLEKCVTNTEWMIKKVREAYGQELKITILSSPGLNVKTITPRFRKVGFTMNTQEMILQLASLYEKMAKVQKCNFINLLGVISPQNYSDGLHPNLAGQEQTAKHIWKSFNNTRTPTKTSTKKN